MGPIRGGVSVNLQVGPTHIEGGTPEPANTPPSLHASSLTLAYLSNHSFMSLNAMESQGRASDKQLATLVKKLIQSDFLQLSPGHQQTGITGVVQYGRQENKNTLVVRAKLNEKSEYDILAVGLRKASGELVSMTLPKPRDEAAGIARSRPSLLSLPNELLQQIAEQTGQRNNGVNVSLRGVNRHMKAIADRQLSDGQRFLVQNGESLEAMGHSAVDMQFLGTRSAAEQGFVLANGARLKELGHNSFAIRELAACPAAQQSFVLTNGARLKALGYRAVVMRFLAACPAAEQDFVLANGAPLKEMGHSVGATQFLATRPAAEQAFVLANGTRLQALGHSAGAMLRLATRPAAEQAFVLYGVRQ